MKPHIDINRLLSFFTALLVVFVSAYGILDQNIYHAKLNSITLYELLGQDIVTFIVGFICLICLVFMNESRKFIKITWLGCITYFIYIYGYFSFSIISSVFYIFYIMIFGISVFILIFELARIGQIKDFISINKSYPRKTLSIFFIAAVFIMLAIEIPYLVQTTIINKKSIIPFDVFYILDLSIVFPAMIIIAIMNLRKIPFSFIFAGIFLIKIITLMPALIFNDFFHWLNTGKFLDITFDIIALIFTLFASALLFLYKRGIKKGKEAS
jgi:hypothetical protein